MLIAFFSGFDGISCKLRPSCRTWLSSLKGRIVCVFLAALCLRYVPANLSGQTIQKPASNNSALQAPAQESLNPMLRDGLYVLQRGDEISIKVYSVPELTETLRIRPDGKISVLMMDDIDAAGLTTKELRDKLVAGYSETIQSPQVSVILRTAADFKVYIGGEVGQPGVIPLLGNLTAVGAILQAGGFKTSARMDSAILIRNNGHGAPVVQKLNLKEALNKGKGDIELKPFDVVYVPLSKIARADRFVQQYTKDLLPITLTGGFSYLLGPAILGVP